MTIQNACYKLTTLNKEKALLPHTHTEYTYSIIKS